MKKFIFVLALAFVVGGFSGHAFAADCALHPEECQGNGSPENVMNVWGTTNSQIPHIKPGTSVLFSNGAVTIDLGCPAWFSNYCVDVTVTQWWKDRWGQALVKI